jgi:WD40 repeat protein
MALFSPDGKAILTNGNAPGRIQLWRAPIHGARPAQLRQFTWNSALASCGAFDPNGQFAVTGTQDHQVLVWAMPEEKEVNTELKAKLSYVEGSLENTQGKMTIRAELENPGWLIPGGMATIVIPRDPKVVAGK